MARPAESYRGARKRRAKSLKLAWRALPRARLKTGAIAVFLPPLPDRKAA